MNKVIYGSYTFEDTAFSLIEGGKATTYYSPLGDELRAAYFNIPVQFFPRIWQVPAEDFKAGAQFGQPVDIYEDSTLLTRFYLTDITGGQRQQDGSYIFNLVGTDFIGLFAGVQHLGGIYTNVAAGSVIAGILGASKTAETDELVIYDANGISYTVGAKLAKSRVDGWLPVTDDARTNLRTVLQLVNASPQQSADGTPHFGVMDHGEAISVDSYEVYQGDAYVEESPVTAVQVLEYAYFQISGTAEEVIYDASAEGVNNDLVTFDRPFYDIHGDANLAVHDTGANYAIVSGTGQLFGKSYTQVSRTLVASTGLTGAANEKTIDNTLCSSLYSSNLLLRMVRYFSTVEKVRHAVVMPQDYDAGQLIDYPDPMLEDRQGYPLELTKTFSGITKADQLITAGWQPTDEEPYTQSELITESGTWTPPEGATRLRLVLIGGGKGGWGGYDGGPGQGSYFDPSTDAGEGGAVGEGGDGGKVLQISFESSDVPASVQVSIGAAGSPGTASHGEGTDGGSTTVQANGTTYTSADGILYPYGVIDVLTGVRYAAKGQDGVYPGNSGVGLNYPNRKSITDTATSQTGTTTTWMDGLSVGTVDGKTYNVGGGGAAYGGDGARGYAGGPLAGGGDGATAVLDGFNGYVVGTPSIPGTGGLGGNGGGGGGCGGRDPDNTYGSGGYDGGAAGAGSAGGPAAPGAVLALIAFGTPPAPVNDRCLFSADGEALFDFNYERLKEAL